MISAIFHLIIPSVRQAAMDCWQTSYHKWGKGKPDMKQHAVVANKAELFLLYLHVTVTW